MQEDRASELLAACLDFLEKSTSTDLSETVHYDGVECDGYCLIADIRACLEDREHVWISVDERLPVTDKNVLTFCVSEEAVFKYCCVAYYVSERCIKLHAPVYEWELDLADFCEEDDSWYIREGWYEVVHNHDEIGCLPIQDTVTHWMPLPERPWITII